MARLIENDGSAFDQFRPSYLMELAQVNEGPGPASDRHLHVSFLALVRISSGNTSPPKPAMTRPAIGDARFRF